ncbi:MAG: ATP-binding protein [Angelakisella sp.]
MQKEIAEAVREQLETRRQRALAEAEERQRTVYQRCPALPELERGMAQAAMEIATVALSPNSVEAIAQLKDKIQQLQAQKITVLTQAGLPADALQPRYSCAQCSDTGFVRGHRCACWDALYQQETSRRLPAAAVDGQCSFATFRLELYPLRDDKGQEVRSVMQGIAARCAEYAEQVGCGAGNLLFMGKTGLGKTHLSLAIAARAAQRGCTVSYSSAQGVIDRFERTRFGRNPTSDDWEFATGVGNAQLLIIDDLGSEFVTSFSQSVLYNIINDRMMNGLSTIVSTNLDAARLSATYEQRISSRLLCGYTALGFSGKDIRLLKRME